MSILVGPSPGHQLQPKAAEKGRRGPTTKRRNSQRNRHVASSAQLASRGNASSPPRLVADEAIAYAWRLVADEAIAYAFIERFHRTLLDEHFRVVGRKKWYETIEEMQRS